MTRRYNASESSRKAKAKRDAALVRNELRGLSEPRRAAASPTSFPIKVDDPADRALIDAALAKMQQ